MKTSILHPRRRTRRGSLFTVMVLVVGVAGLLASLTIGMGLHNSLMEGRNLHRIQARYAAEAALQHAMFRIKNDDSAFNASQSLSSALQYDETSGEMPNMPADIQDLDLTIENAPSGVDGVYLVTASVTRDKVQTEVSGIVQKDPPSKVFDYEYFLNNWGWWWGNSITGNGDQRSNGRFDFRSSPTVNGHVHAALGIYRNNNEWFPGNAIGVRGLAGNDPDSYLHAYMDRLEMPNLNDLSHYRSLANNYERSDGGTGGRITYTDANTGEVRTITAEHAGSLYLEGTAQNPIQIEGPVVISDNLAIQGYITGQGTLYTGRNTYIMGPVSYVNGPSFPLTEAQLADWAYKDQWVVDNASADLVAFAATENILFGDLSNRGQWYNPWQNSSYGIRNAGDEHVGPDGIPGTADDNVAFDHDGDGTIDSNWFDIDGDGQVDDNYTWEDIAPGIESNGDYPDSSYTAGDMGHYTNWPKKNNGQPKTFRQVVQTASVMDGIYYTNHALAGDLNGHVRFNGSYIAKDEAVTGFSSITLNYDWRIHSRYNNDPNRLVDLGLPRAGATALLAWKDGQF